MIQIDKNIPIPPRPTLPGRPSKYPFAEMEVGDSFATDKPCRGTTISGSINFAAKKLGYKFTSRKQADGTIRVWRIA